MSLLPELTNPYVTALTGGFLYGLVFCTSTCLPYIASYIAGINADFRRGFKATLFFNSGRIVAYAIVGAILGIFKLLINDAFRSAFQLYSSLAFGAVTILMGVTVLVRNRHGATCNCPPLESSKRKVFGGFALTFDARACTLGLSRGLLLCTPLIILLTYSLAFASPFDSFALAVLFGVGTTLSPILLLGGLTGWLLNKAPLFRTWISRLGAIALVVLGLITLIGAITV